MLHACTPRPLLLLMLLLPATGMSGGFAVGAAAATEADLVAIAAELARADCQADQAGLAERADAIAEAGAADVVACLAAFGEATPGGANWLRSGLDRAADRLGGALAADGLAACVADRSRAAKARILAASWLRARDPALADQLLDTMLDDPCLELRRGAVERLLAKGAEGGEATLRQASQEALTAARDIDQVERVVQWLSEHGEKVDLAGVLGFVQRWRVSDAFDNAGGAGFGTAYPPEDPDVAATLVGGWKEVATSDRLGIVDLNATIAQKKGVCAYAAAVVDMAAPVVAEVRLGSPCAVKVWVNGKPVMDHEIYHASEEVDQYVGTAEFRAGGNTILVKCCQNEQTEPWTEAWKFQLRVCDRLGTPLGSQPGKDGR